MTALAGIIPFKIGELRTSIEVLRSFPGMPKARLQQWALTANRSGKEIRVLDPLSLLSSKLFLALKVDQKERRDVEHLRIMLVCVRAFLRETLRGVEAGALPARGWLGAVERVLKLAESSHGKKAVRTLGVDWTTGATVNRDCRQQSPRGYTVPRKAAGPAADQDGLPGLTVVICPSTI